MNTNDAITFAKGIGIGKDQILIEKYVAVHNKVTGVLNLMGKIAIIIHWLSRF